MQYFIPNYHLNSSGICSKNPFRSMGHKFHLFFEAHKQIQDSIIDFNIKMQHQTFDYRNGKYQGPMNSLSQRHGVGIFIDDDLTFYLSHWKSNKLNGPTLIYISHGKYIYGEWKDNLLSGLSVFRFGETVLIGNFKDNFPTNRCFIIFQRFNFACVLEQKDQQWNIVCSGELTSHNMLLKIIEKAGFVMPQHYFSLTKFVCNTTINSHYLKTFPCFVGCCYFGFFNGLGMIFNSNNGLVSIGQHTAQKLSDFGGKFDNSKTGCEGNFRLKEERITYQGDRPVKKIYAIFQKMHKQSLNFINQYFDFKLKVFSNVQSFIRQQFQIILSECKNKYNIDSADLNESLDYQEYTQEQSFKINSMRDAVYEAKAKNTKDQVNMSAKTDSSKFKAQKQMEAGPKRHQSFVKGKQKQKNQKSTEFKTQQKRQAQVQSKQIECEKEENKVYAARRSPFRNYNASKIKQQEDQSIPIKNYGKTIQSCQQTEKRPLQKSSMKDTTKNKDKLKSNNHIYTQHLNGPYKSQKQSSAFKNVSTPKNNNVYKEATKRDSEQSPGKYRVPTFKALLQENASSRPSQAKNQFEKIQIDDHNKALKSKRSDIYQPSKPSYEDIQERKRRILQSYKQSRNQIKTSLHSINNFGAVCQFNSPTQAFNIYSSPKEEQQGSFGVFPLSLFAKKQQGDSIQPINHVPAAVEGPYNLKNKQIQEKRQEAVKKVEKMYAVPQKSYFQSPRKEGLNQNRNKVYLAHAKSYEIDMKKNEQLSKQNINEAFKAKGKVLPSQQSNYQKRSSPLKPKKSYQYIYQ